jgi:hypothetical protein
MKFENPPISLESRVSTSSASTSNGAQTINRLRSLSGLQHRTSSDLSQANQRNHLQLPSQFAPVSSRSEQNEQEVLLILCELNSMLGLSMDEEVTSLAFRLLEKGYDPSFLAQIIAESNSNSKHK